MAILLNLVKSIWEAVSGKYRYRSMMNSSHVAGVRVTVLVIKIMSHLLCKKHEECRAWPNKTGLNTVRTLVRRTQQRLQHWCS